MARSPVACCVSLISDGPHWNINFVCFKETILIRWIWIAVSQNVLCFYLIPSVLRACRRVRKELVLVDLSQEYMLMPWRRSFTLVIVLTVSHHKVFFLVDGINSVIIVICKALLCYKLSTG